MTGAPGLLWKCARTAQASDGSATSSSVPVVTTAANLTVWMLFQNPPVGDVRRITMDPSLSVALSVVDASSGSPSNVGLIVGLAVGLTAAAVAIMVVLLVMEKRRREARARANFSSKMLERQGSVLTA